jgi:hypothetical protein
MEHLVRQTITTQLRNIRNTIAYKVRYELREHGRFNDANTDHDRLNDDPLYYATSDAASNGLSTTILRASAATNPASYAGSTPTTSPASTTDSMEFGSSHYFLE